MHGFTLFITLLTTSLITLASANCDYRTKTFLKQGNSNSGNYYYISETYLHTAENIIASTYRKRLDTAGITCSGRWCPHVGWFDRAASIGYQVEHIIPRHNTISDLVGCCGTKTKNHCDNTANFIMAYSVWNNQISNQISEKVEIYGEKMVTNAYREVYISCHGHYPTALPADLCLPTSSNFTAVEILVAELAIITMIKLLFVMIMIVLIYRGCVW